MYCNNCGKKSHIYKECLLPKISLGIILYTYIDKVLHYLLVRRKDTIGYIEFLRGKYIKNDIEYIQTLFNQMTNQEHKMLIKYDFNELWEKLWMTSRFKNTKKNFHYEFKNSKRKFNELKKGYTMGKTKYTIYYFIRNSNKKWIEPEWGFPKGRRNKKESDIDAARRECMEETGLLETQFKINPIITFKEEYTGSDNNKYRHIYYIGEYTGNSLNTNIDINEKHQVSEISKLGFYTFNESYNLIRDYYVEKKNILSKVHLHIIENKV